MPPAGLEPAVPTSEWPQTAQPPGSVKIQVSNNNQYFYNFVQRLMMDYYGQKKKAAY
jgi:hypothetical protein